MNSQTSLTPPNPYKNSNQHLGDLTDAELESNLHLQVNAERAATTAVLHHLREVERRRLYARRGFASLFEYCTRQLGYSESQAQRRISSARLLAELPELENKISDGTLNLTHLSQAQSFFRIEAKTASAYTAEQKREVLTRLENQPARTTEKILVSLATNPTPAREITKPVAAGQTELRIVMSEQTMQELERLKQIWSHKMPGASLGQLIAEAVKTSVEQLDPELQAQRREQRREQMRDQRLGQRRDQKISESHKMHEDAKVHKDEQNQTKTLTQKTNNPTHKLSAAKASGKPTRHASCEPATNQRGVYSTSKVTAQPENSRYISARTKDAVRVRDHGRCTYVDAQTGRRCESRHQLEFDHLKPHALGGANDHENLRLRCRNHNLLHAFEHFGEKHMRKFVDGGT